MDRAPWLKLQLSTWLDLVGRAPGSRIAMQAGSNRWLWRQTAGLNALTTNACGQSAWWKLLRSILGVGSLVEAAAEHFRHLKAGKRQA